MTTGRINQVAIVTGQAVPERTIRRDFPGRKPESLRGQGAEPKPSARSEGAPGAEAARDAPDHPFAPTELPKERSAADVGMRDAERRPTLRHAHLRRRIPATHHARRRLHASVDPRMS